MDSELHKKVHAIHYSNFRGNLLFEKPLINKYGIENIKQIKREIKTETRWK